MSLVGFNFLVCKCTNNFHFFYSLTIKFITMNKILKSGIIVDDNTYYQLLDWKNSNPSKFDFWVMSYRVTHSINDLSLENYNALLLFANLD